MNTTEVKTKGLIRSWEDLWLYARKQFVAYEKIEGIEDWDDYDFSIDCSDDQTRFKDMLQIRCIEELTEATHALDNEEHFYEEITDSLNFLLSAYCMIGADFSALGDPESMIYMSECDFCFSDLSDPFSRKELFSAFYTIVDAIGNLCNLLKNRPWAQSNYLVSLSDFDQRLKELWVVFWSVINWMEIPKEKIFDMFERKYLVNRFRISTGY